MSNAEDDITEQLVSIMMIETAQESEHKPVHMHVSEPEASKIKVDNLVDKSVNLDDATNYMTTQEKWLWNVQRKEYEACERTQYYIQRAKNLKLKEEFYKDKVNSEILAILNNLGVEVSILEIVEERQANMKLTPHDIVDRLITKHL